MNRFRVTFIAVCLVLAWLAYADISLMLRNPAPLSISIAELEAREKPPREWLTVTAGYPQFLQGINMTGSVEFTAFLVPLTTSPDNRNYKVWFETRDPEILEALKIYYFTLDTEEQRQAFIKEKAHIFSSQRPLTGMTAADLVANSNQRQLIKLMDQMGIETTETPIFISENKKPVVWRGIFYAMVAIAGLVKLSYNLRSSTK